MDLKNVEPRSGSFVDRLGQKLHQGAKVWHYPYRGNTRHRAVVTGSGILGHMVEIQLDGDPFPVNVDHRRVEKMKEQGTMAAATKPSAAEYRAAAKELGIENWEEMGKDDLIAAVDAARGDDTPATPAKKATKKATKAPAKKTAAKKAPASKRPPAKKAAASKKASASSGRANPNPDDPIPFRPGTNLYLIAKALMKGGKRSALVAQLAPKLEYKPRKQSAKDFDREAETDRRLKVIGYILKNQHGWTYAHKGRGADAQIHVTPPGVANKLA